MCNTRKRIAVKGILRPPTAKKGKAENDEDLAERTKGSVIVKNPDVSHTDCLNDGRPSHSSSTSSSPKERIVRFTDEITNGVLRDVVEIEEFKEYCKFTTKDRAKAEQEWCKKLLEELNVEEGGVARLRGYVVELAVSADSYEVVQCAVESARGEEVALLLKELAGYVNLLATSTYGAEVLQTCLECMRPADVSFMVEELAGNAAAVARSEAGLAVLCRIFEYLPSKYTAPLVEELLMSVRSLCCHQYGGLVISHIIDYSSRPHQRRVCEMITTDADFLSRHISATPLVKKAWLFLLTKMK